MLAWHCAEPPSYLLTPLNATNLTNVQIEMYGNLHLSQNITSIQQIVNKTSSGNVYWITIQGSNVTYLGTTNVSTGWVYGEAPNPRAS